MRTIVFAGGIAFLTLFFAAKDAMAQPRTCVRADVQETFALPDGSQHAAGTLRICLDRDYSPVAGLHSIAADGRARGRFLSRRMKPEGENVDGPRLAFVRDAAGVLVLRGYTVARRGGVEAYWLESPRGSPGGRVESPVVVAARAPGTVWLAAAISR